VHDSPVDPSRQLVPRVDEHLHHLPVLAEHVRLERADALRPGDVGEPIEHPRADPASLPRIGDRKRHLSAVGHIGTVASGRGDDPPAALPHQRVPDRGVGRGKTAYAVGVELSETHEPHVGALRRERTEEREQRWDILWLAGSQRQGRAVTEDDVKGLNGRSQHVRAIARPTPPPRPRGMRSLPHRFGKTPHCCGKTADSADTCPESLSYLHGLGSVDWHSCCLLEWQQDDMSSVRLATPTPRLDGVVLLPLTFVGGVWLWRREPMGYALAGLLLVKLGATFLTLVATSAVAWLWGQTLDVAETLAYATGMVCALALEGPYLRSVKARKGAET
jgi:hypothetical protein